MRPFANGILSSSLIIPRAKYGRTCSVRLKITGRLEWESRETAVACVAASPQEALGYESRRRGKETRSGSNGRENVVVVYIREWERRAAAIPRTLKGNKEASHGKVE